VPRSSSGYNAAVRMCAKAGAQQVCPKQRRRAGQGCAPAAAHAACRPWPAGSSCPRTCGWPWRASARAARALSPNASGCTGQPPKGALRSKQTPCKLRRAARRHALEPADFRQRRERLSSGSPVRGARATPPPPQPGASGTGSIARSQQQPATVQTAAGASAPSTVGAERLRLPSVYRRRGGESALL